jgi:8-oxo-dGTP pyrophosphatase MutT (NUDIX family)
MKCVIPPLPEDLPIVERDAVRIVVQDARGEILLFRTREFGAPELGYWWELPGGGVDAGESYVTVAVRELCEETGIVISADRVGRPTWRRTASFRHRDRRHLQHEVVVLVCLDIAAPELDTTARLDYEVEDYTDHRWWPVAAILASRERFYPGRLPELLPALLAGVEVDEPFELFS